MARRSARVADMCSVVLMSMVRSAGGRPVVCTEPRTTLPAKRAAVAKVARLPRPMLAYGVRRSAPPRRLQPEQTSEVYEPAVQKRSARR